MKRVTESAFGLVWNGFSDGAPAAVLRDYLVEAGAKVVTVVHPLVPESHRRHEISAYADGRQLETRSVSVPIGPPTSFALDPLIPLRLPRVDVWFGFNCVAAARGLVARRFRRAGQVVYWCVDFVPNRFGKSPLTTLYDALDRSCCVHVDARFELSAAAREGRNARHKLDRLAFAPAHVVPMGAWVDRVPATDADSFGRRTVVYLGHLVPRQGVSLLLEALAVLHVRGVDLNAVIVGGGPLEAELRAQSATLGLADIVRFRGFVEDNQEVERLLAASSIAVAPYVPDPGSFSRWADPGKLKAYVAAGLPTLVTDVPPNARELAEDAGAQIVPFTADGFAAAIEHALSDRQQWLARRAEALSFARRFDWPTIMNTALSRLGFEG